MAYITFLSLASWFIATISIGFVQDYKKCLCLNIFATLCLSSYFYFFELHIASIVYLLSSANSLAQLLIPESHRKRNIIARNLIAIFISLLVSFLLFEKLIDFLPCFAFISSRLGEAQQSAVKLKIGMIIGIIIWINYGILNELYLMSFLKFVIGMSFVRSLVKHNQQAEV